MWEFSNLIRGHDPIRKPVSIPDHVRDGLSRDHARAKLERQQHVHYLLAVARLWHVGDLAAVAMDCRLRIT